VVSDRFQQPIKGNRMKKTAIAFALCTSFVFSTSALAQQGRNFDESGASWIQKTDMAMKGNSKTSAQIRAEANQFLRFNKWDVGSSKFIPVTGKTWKLACLQKLTCTIFLAALGLTRQLVPRWLCRL
jgi:hypothetical protein